MRAAKPVFRVAHPLRCWRAASVQLHLTEQPASQRKRPWSLFRQTGHQEQAPDSQSRFDSNDENTLGGLAIADEPEVVTVTYGSIAHLAVLGDCPVESAGGGAHLATRRRLTHPDRSGTGAAPARHRPSPEPE